MANDNPDTTRSWRPSDPVGKLQWLYIEHCVRVNHALAKGCRCGSCHTFRISWEDCSDVEQAVEDEMLEGAIDAAWWSLEGNQQ